MKCEYARRILRALFGLMLYACGTCCNIQANLGLGAWEAFSMGLGSKLGMNFGVAHTVFGFAILALDLFFHEKIGIGTLLNIVCIGPAADVLRSLGIIPMMHSFLPGVAVLLLGQCFVALGSYFYISPGLGCGPRDSLMVALCKRFSRAPVGLIRFFLEGGALLTGWLCGAKVGVGTLVAVFGVSFIIQITFSLLHFDVSKVEHDDIFTSVKKILGR